MFAVICCTLSSTSRSDSLFYPVNLWPAFISHCKCYIIKRNIVLLTRMSTVSNSLLVFLRDNFGIELKNCIRNLLIFIFRETKRAPRRPPSIPRRMVGMKAKTFKSSKFLTWVKEMRKNVLSILPDMKHRTLSYKTWYHKVIPIQEINLFLWFRELS